MPYRIKHISTGLYYQPHKYRGNNLSKKGKMYHTEANAKSALKTISHVQVEKDSVVHRLTKDILAYQECKWSYNQLLAGVNKYNDWVIEEMIDDNSLAEFGKRYFKQLLSNKSTNFEYGEELSFIVRFIGKDGNIINEQDIITINKSEL